MDGGQGQAVRSKEPVALDIVLVNGKGQTAIFPRGSYVTCERNPESPARNDGTTFIHLVFPTVTWRIRGNRTAMDLIQKLFLDHLLHWIEVTPGANPDRDETSNVPIVYSVSQLKFAESPVGTTKGGKP